MNPHELKELQGRLAKLEARGRQINDEMVMLKDCQKENNKKIADIKSRMDQLKKSPTVSEHAILRFIEREIGISIDDMRKQIMTDELRAMIKAYGDGKYPLGQCKAVVKGGVVVTVE